nr:hypothetical protein [Vibrio parahaemolyticus]
MVSCAVCFFISEADLCVKSPLCEIVFPKEPFGVVSSFFTALYIPSGLSNRRFESAPDLSFSKHIQPVLAKRQ